MSYDLCKRISLDKKNNKISICVASSNLIPKHYDTYEIYGGYKTYNFEDKLLSLYIDMQSGNIQISSINDSTIDVELFYAVIEDITKYEEYSVTLEEEGS